MFGLMVFGALGLYLLISIWVVGWAVGHARKHGKSVKRWGWGAALVMYSLVFWDLLPTVLARQYQCNSNAGYFVYKDLDQWKVENPGIFETLSITHLPEQFRVDFDPRDIKFILNAKNRKYVLPDGTTLIAMFDSINELMWVEYKKADGESGYQLNERFRYRHENRAPNYIKLARNEIILTDTLKNEVVAREINFKYAGRDWTQFWFTTSHTCFEDYPEKFPDGGILKYMKALHTDCSPEHKDKPFSSDIKVSCR